MASGQDVRLILDRPVLTLEVAGQRAYLEPDALTHRIEGKFHVVLIRSFAAIDGQANPTAVAEAAKQAADVETAIYLTEVGTKLGKTWIGAHLESLGIASWVPSTPPTSSPTPLKERPRKPNSANSLSTARPQSTTSAVASSTSAFPTSR